MRPSIMKAMPASLTQVGETQIAPTIPTLSVKNSLLYPDAQLTISQSRLLVFQYSLRHSLIKKAFTELLQLLSVHLPPKSCMPTSVHKLKQVIIEEFPEVTVEEHHYCTFCQRLLQSDSQLCQGEGCSGGRPAVFITLPLEPQLRRMMECMCVSHYFIYILLNLLLSGPYTWALLQERFKRQNVPELRDVYDL